MSLLIKGVLDRPSVESHGQEALTFYDKIPAEYTLDPLFKEAFTTLGQKLQNCRRPVLVCGLDMVRLTTPDLVANHALLLKQTKERIGLFYLLPGPNAFGAALFSPHDSSLRNILDGIEKRMIKALILVETDPFSLFPDQRGLKEALEKLDFVLVIDYLPSRVADDAHIFLPSRTPFETASSFINQEGRLQLAAPVHAGGTPLSQISSGDHPPRLFHKEIPGGEPKAAWEILGELADEISFSRDNPWLRMANENPVFGALPFEALVMVDGPDPDTSIFVGDQRILRYYPSATVLAQQRGRAAKPTTRPLLALGNPTYLGEEPSPTDKKKKAEQPVN